MSVVNIPILDVRKNYKTVCGYPTKDLKVVVTAVFDVLHVEVHGSFLGSENIWFTHIWDRHGVDTFGTREMNLERVPDESQN